MNVRKPYQNLVNQVSYMRAVQSYNHVKCWFQHPYTLRRAFDVPIDNWLYNVVYKCVHPTLKMYRMEEKKKQTKPK